MKKILQALDGVATKPVEGADSMAKFLRVVKEAEINQQFPPDAPLPQLKVPPIPQLTAQDGDLGNGSRVTTNADGTRSYSSGMGTFTYDAQGKAITYTSPKMSGYGQTIDLATNQIVHDYHAGPLQLNYKADAQGRPITSRAKYDLGVATLGHDNDHVSGIRSTEVAPRVGDGSDTAATLAMAHKIMPTSDIAAARGVDPKKFAAFQKQNPTAVKENSLSKFLSIVDKSNVDILNEGKGPLNRLTQAESIAVYHSKPVVARETITSPVLNVAVGAKPSMIGKYFKTVEQEFVEGADRTKNRARRLAERIIERVTIGPDGKVTGVFKPQLSEPVPSAEPASAPSNVKPSGSTVEYGGSTYSVNVFGDGMRPRIGRSDKVVTAKVYTLGDKMYVLLDPAAQEGVAEDKDPCWDSHKMVGTKKKGGRTVPNCVPK